MKKIIVMTTAILTLSAVLSGCSSSATKENTAKSTSESTKDKASSSKMDPYKLTIVYATGAVPKDLKAVQEKMNAYLTDKINATVELKPIEWGTWIEKTNLMIATNEQMDVMMTAGGLGYSQNVAKGAFLPLDELIAKYGADVTKALQPQFLDGTRIGGKIYGLPTNKEFASVDGILFNKALVDKYKFDISKVNKLEDLEPMLQTIKDNEPGIVPFFGQEGRQMSNFAVSSSSFDNLGDYLGGLDRSSKELKVVDIFESKVFMDYAKLARKWYQAKYMNLDAATVKDFGAMQAGKAFAMYSELKPGKDAEMSSAWGVKVVQKEMVNTPITLNTTGIMTAIPKTSKDPNRAMMFLNMLYSDKTLLNLFDFGIEGTHYVKKDETTIDFPAGVDAASVGYKNEPWMWGNQMLTYLFPNEDPKKWEKFKTFNETADKSPALGFAWNSESLTQEVAASNSVLKQYQQAIMSGSVDPDVYIPKMIAALKSAGIDKIIAEKQKQLNEWSATAKK
ncbi:ABC transporter substrate-binding protein [Paenibacillus alba]|uniref:Extracellular solute-binding protein n=1 Tax=Paenibacillus alba TaxID=1197127 RepID=A0ABU6G6K1_9BACL|nr:extracellular solute-binding protein [Paenibacillus alba]MEC0229808.1 extracellular solute-binding protein [Paenibacillus alba]